MFSRTIRSPLASTALLAGFAGAAAAQDSAPRVEYRYFGQGAYVLVTPTNTRPTPYALTGRPSQDDRRDTQNVRVLEVGQGRYIVPVPTR